MFESFTAHYEVPLCCKLNPLPIAVQVSSYHLKWLNIAAQLMIIVKFTMLMMMSVV